MKKLEVGLGDRAYPIMIDQGLLGGIGPDLAAREIGSRYVVIADDLVASLYGDLVLESCRGAGLEVDLLTFAHGEASKHLGTIADLCSRLAGLGVDRKSCIIALGGGVSGDMAGFIAAVYMRGIPFVQVPTTLLAQVDSSVGGKTGVDIPEGKNLVGAFNQPQAVYIDSLVLQSLPPAELLNGLAEVLKYGVIYDGEFFEFLAANRPAISALDLTVLEEVILRCCAIKAEVVAADEKEADLRRILNYGHTLGHAVEAASDFTIAHGMAVAMGMVAVNEIARSKGIFSADQADRVREVVSSFGLPVLVPKELDRAEIKAFLKTDKKTIGGRPFFVLPTAIGKVIISDEVSVGQIDAALALA